MASPDFNRIASVDSFPLSDRLHMRINLMEKTLQTSFQGRNATEEEIGTALWCYQNSLTEAEAQIEALQSLLRELVTESDDPDIIEYLEEYPDLDQSERMDYLIGERKQSLFIAMFKGDEKHISKFLNEIHLMEQKKEVTNG